MVKTETTGPRRPLLEEEANGSPQPSPQAQAPGLDQIMRTLGSAAESRPPPQAISSTPLPVLAPQPLSVSAAPPPVQGAALPVPTPRKRFGNKEKIAAVMRVLQGEERDWVAMTIGATGAMLDRWQDAFLNGGVAALGTKPKEQRSPKGKKAAPVEEASIDDLKAKLHALIRTVEVLSSQIQAVPSVDAVAPPVPALSPPSPPPNTPPPGFPAEISDPPPRPKRSRKPPRR